MQENSHLFALLKIVPTIDQLKTDNCDIACTSGAFLGDQGCMIVTFQKSDRENPNSIG